MPEDGRTDAPIGRARFAGPLRGRLMLAALAVTAPVLLGAGLWILLLSQSARELRGSAARIDRELADTARYDQPAEGIAFASIRHPWELAKEHIARVAEHAAHRDTFERHMHVAVGGLTDDDHDPALVRGTTELARSLGLRLVAEGIESPEQEAILRASTAPLGQGFLFARPLVRLVGAFQEGSDVLREADHGHPP
jgi:hypothetical protein